MNPLELLVRKLSSQTYLDEADHAAILALPGSVRVLEPSTYVLREGEPPANCAIMTSGYAYRHKLTVEGARQIVGLHVGGDPLDFATLFLEVADHNIQTLTRAQLVFVARADLHTVIERHPNIARAVMVHASIEASILREWIVNVGRRDALTRVAHLLCELSVRLMAVGLSDDHRFELPITQEQMGDALGLTPVHVNRTLKVLESRGLIVRSKRSIAMRDWRELRETAGFNTRYLHLDKDLARRVG